MTAGWPEPYLQPDRNKDCGYYAQAYLARCLGHPDVTAGQVRDWRAETRYHETQYARRVLGAQMRSYADHREDEKRRKWYWLGPGLDGWIRGILFTGWIGQAMVHRIPDFGHAVVVLGSTVEGVQLMDPLSGFVTEPWDWFLGPGPGHGAHHIEGWYLPPGVSAPQP
ncbi:MAG TPA: hypothetical protein VMV92_18350 [Streptosporangiaceae bacterium]|nr:hypothetical protein [Streptosporangiaceae bacterium]